MIYTSDKVNTFIDELIPGSNSLQQYYNQLLKNTLSPNLYYDKESTEKLLKQKNNTISKTQEILPKEMVIIYQNNKIDDNKFLILSSLKNIYKNQIQTKESIYYLTIGYLLLIVMIILIFSLYLFYFQRNIYDNNRYFTFLISNILLTALVTVKVLDSYPYLLYLIPLCILPIIIQAFFNFELSIITHVTNVLLLSIIVPNSFNFILIQINAGIAVLITQKTIYTRTNLLIAVGKAMLVYMITYFGLTLICEETLNKNIIYNYICLFFNSILILFAQPLIYIFEKLFKLTSDLSLLELSDTKMPILRILSQKAPGTLQHALTVANLAEEAALETGANPLLTRIGAIYHDIGKIEYAIYFTENQQNMINPHEDLSPEESTQIILSHVPLGIKLAKEYHLPDRVIDFIRTHHGDTFVYYFYKKHKKQYPDKKIDKEAFRYPGPKPFSKETVIVMICDAIEAASKSIKEPSNKNLEDLVETIVNKQKKENQFSNTNITLKEIERIKHILKKKLIMLHHTRIKYPE
ncbi:MAG: HDIG domain-containing metalloprotein [Flavobacteriales bacterium]